MNKKRLFSLAIILLYSIPLFAQSVDTAWVRRYNGPGDSTDYAQSIAVDNSSHVYVTGYSYNSGTDYDYATVKYYPNGDTAWIRRYNGPIDNTDKAVDIAVDDSGYVYVTGESWGSGTSIDYVSIKYYSNGDTAWVRRYNGPANSHDLARSLTIDDSGCVYITGLSSGIGTNYDYASIKYDSNGDTTWVRRYNGAGNGSDNVRDIEIDDSGNVYVTGYCTGSGSGFNYSTIKYYSNGDTAWVREYAGSGSIDDYAQDLAVDDSGNVYVTGYSGGPSANDYVTIKYYPDGDTSWVRRYDGPGSSNDWAYTLAVDSSSNVYVSGGSFRSGTGHDYTTIKYDSEGNELWVGRYNGTGGDTDIGYSLVIDIYGDVYVTGYSYGGILSSTDYATIKYYSDGNVAWVQRYNAPSNNQDRAYEITVDESGSVYVTGRSYETGAGDDYVTIKYVQFLRGNVNSDTSRSVSDVVYLINYLFKGGPEPYPAPIAGDANCDSTVSVSDVVYLINYLFKGGPEPCI